MGVSTARDTTVAISSKTTLPGSRTGVTLEPMVGDTEREGSGGGEWGTLRQIQNITRAKLLLVFRLQL